MKIKAVIKNSEKIYIKTEYITLDNALKLAGIAETGGHAKLLIKDGLVSVNKEVCMMRGKKLYPNTIFEFDVFFIFWKYSNNCFKVIPPLNSPVA